MTRTDEQLARWADSRETALPVARAIHAIADQSRTADEIWTDPTDLEWGMITAAVREYVDRGEYPAEEDGRYHWGKETFIYLPPTDTA